MSDGKRKTCFIDGSISPSMIGDAIAKHGKKTSIGAHSIFIGQVRSDVIGEKTVKGIEYSAYREMAENEFHKIREAAFAEFNLTCLHIHHSLGAVRSGEINMFIFVSSAHRKAAIEACSEIVEKIKSSVPIFGKEIFEDETFQWKVNR